MNLIHPEDRARAAEAAAAAITAARATTSSTGSFAPTARCAWSTARATWYGTSGRPVRQFGVMQDITELRRAEDELRAKFEEAHFGRCFITVVSQDRIFLPRHSGCSRRAAGM